MKILCKVPSGKFFDFFEDLYELFGDNWETFEMDDSLMNYLGCGFLVMEFEEPNDAMLFKMRWS